MMNAVSVRTDLFVFKADRKQMAIVKCLELGRTSGANARIDADSYAYSALGDVVYGAWCLGL